MKGKLAIGAIIGAGVGIVAGVLTAPKSGRETREDIKLKSEELKDKAGAKKDDLMFKAEELGDDLRTKASEAFESIKNPGKK